jgi:hypothetical protein
MISKSREAIARRIPGGSCLDALGEKKRPALMAALAKQNWRLARLMVDSGASMSARHEGVGALDVLAVSASPEAQALGVHMLALQASGRGVGSCMDNQRALAVLEKARRVGESLLPKAMKWCGINAGSQNYEPGMCLPDHASLKKLDEELSAIYGDAKVGALEAMGELARKAREELRLALERGGAAAARKPAI